MNRFFQVCMLMLFFSGAISCQKKAKKQLADKVIRVIDKAMVKSEVFGKEVQLIDVRTPEEYEAGHIDDAVNYNIIDSATFLKQIEGLEKSEPVYLYCKMGGRSNRAAELLKEKGFTKLYDYSGGYNDWVSE